MKRLAAAACSVFVVLTLAATAQASRLGDRAVEVGPGITPPCPTNVQVLETPEGVAEPNTHATLNVRLLIDKSSRVRRVEVLDAPDPRLADAAVAWFKTTSCSPAMRDSKPVAVWWNQGVSFRPRAELDTGIPAPDCVPEAYELALIDDLTKDVEFPRLLEKVDPEYPAGVESRNVGGHVLLSCVIDTCGHVRDCRVLDASAHELTTAALDAAVRRRYVPAFRHGKPITIMFTIETRFNR
jgi:TonB family protein